RRHSSCPKARASSICSSPISRPPDSTMRMASSVPAMTSSRGEVASSLYVGLATSRPSTRATRAAPSGPENGMPESATAADERAHVGIVFVVRGNHEVDDLQLVAKALREQRAKGAVDQTARQGFFLVRSTFALEEATGDAASRVGLFPVLDGEREKVPVAS